MALEHAEALHALIIEHCGHLGIATHVLDQVSEELESKSSCAEGSLLLQLYAYCVDGSITMPICSLAGKLCTISATTASLVKMLKVDICNQLAIPVREQKLVYRGQRMSDDEVLAAYNVTPLDASLTMVRVQPPKLYVVGGRGGLGMEEALASVEVLDTADGTWERRPPMASPRHDFALEVIQNQLYAVGGHDDSPEGLGVLSSAETFNPIDDEARWHPIAPMMNARSNFASAVVDDKLYVFGGDSGDEVMGSCEVFDPDVGRWEWLPPMPTARFYTASAVLGSKIYVTGGDTAEEALACCEVFDTLSHTWDTLPCMETPRFGHRMEILHGKLICVGGFDGAKPLAEAEIFDPSSRVWTCILPMWNVRTRASSCVCDSKLYLCGGFDGNEALVSGEAYDQDIGAWIPLPEMRSSRLDAALATADGKMYMLGGDTGESDEALSTAEVFDPVTGEWKDLLPMETPRRSAAVAVVTL